MSTPLPSASRNALLSLVLKDRAALYAAYMPFLKNGGLFLPGSKPYQLGEDVFFLLVLPDAPDQSPVVGRVAWITPQGAQGNRTAGIGVQFNEAAAPIRARIEKLLAGSLDADRPTHTL